MSVVRGRFFRAGLTVHQLLMDLQRTHAHRPVRMLDVGGAHGIHARFFRSQGLEVDIIDIMDGEENLLFIGDYLNFIPHKPYDVIWSSHVLEHVPNVGLFLDKMHADLDHDGYLAVTVPPIREQKMTVAHLTFWNPGMLLLNAGLHGFDVTGARLARYNYDVSIITRKSKGDAEQDIASSIPSSMKVGDGYFSGNPQRVNWESNFDDLINQYRCFEYSELDGSKRMFYTDAMTGERMPC